MLTEFSKHTGLSESIWALCLRPEYSAELFLVILDIQSFLFGLLVHNSLFLMDIFIVGFYIF